MARTVVALFVIVGLIAGAWWLFRDRLSGAADDLRVGDCFTVPAEDRVSSIQHQPCTDLHDGEVFVVGTVEGDTFPVVFGFDDWAQEHCAGDAFTAYVGEAFEARADIDIGYFSPTQDGWSSGDRTVTCYLTPGDGSPVSASYQAAAGAN